MAYTKVISKEVTVIYQKYRVKLVRGLLFLQLLYDPESANGMYFQMVLVHYFI